MNTMRLIGKATTADLSRILRALVRSGCCGDFSPSLANRMLSAADDSMFLIIPVAVLRPRGEDDVDRTIALAASGDFKRPPPSGRGGRTDTNSQSPTFDVAIERSRARNPVKRGLLKHVRSRCRQLTASLSRTCRRRCSPLTFGGTP